jgi:hypothetical protein
VPTDVGYAYLSAAGDFVVSHVVDDVKGVHCLIRKNDFAAWTRAAPPARRGSQHNGRPTQLPGVRGASHFRGPGVDRTRGRQTASVSGPHRSTNSNRQHPSTTTNPQVTLVHRTKPTSQK